MATKAVELYGTQSFAGVDGIHVTDSHDVLFIVGSGTVLRGTPVVRNSSTGFWTVWANGGTNDTGNIRGFTREDVVLDGSDNVLGGVMFAGELNYDDVVLPAGESESNLKLALVGGTPTLREMNIRVSGVTGVR